MLGTIKAKNGSTVITNFNKVEESASVFSGYFDGDSYLSRTFDKNKFTFTADIPAFTAGQVAFLDDFVPAVRTNKDWVHVNESGAVTSVTRDDEWVWKTHLNAIAAGRHSIITDVSGRELHR